MPPSKKGSHTKNRESDEPSAKEDAAFKSHRPTGKLQKIRSQIPDGLKLSRKDLRKEMRQMKKARKHAYHSGSKVGVLSLCSILNLWLIFVFKSLALIIYYATNRHNNLKLFSLDV